MGPLDLNLLITPNIFTLYLDKLGPIVELLYDLDITGLMQVVYIVMVNPGNQMDCNLKI